MATIELDLKCYKSTEENIEPCLMFLSAQILKIGLSSHNFLVQHVAVIYWDPSQTFLQQDSR